MNEELAKELISRLLKNLNFVFKDIDKEAYLQVALAKKITSATITGSNEKIILNRYPDYILYLDKKAHCVLDAKASDVDIGVNSKAEQQVFYYAINKEIKTPFYALCNGKVFNLFSTQARELLLSYDVNLNDLEDKNFKLLKQYLSTPLQSLKQNLKETIKENKKDEQWYLNRELPKAILHPKKRKAARHFGCTGYFTKQSWDILERHILNFTDEGDVVFDPFGGSGVTAIEAMMKGRIGIHTDLNPLSVFMVKALSSECDLSELYEFSEEIIKEFNQLKPKNEKEVKELLKNAKYYPNAIDEEFGEIATQKQQDTILWIPKDELLPKGSDVETTLKLFSKRQLVELALLRKLIFKKTSKDRNKKIWEHRKRLRYSLLLAFRNVVTMHNKTYHTNAKNQGGNTGVYMYYRYRVALKPTPVDIIKVFQHKIKLVIKGKSELKESSFFYPSYYHGLQGVIKDFTSPLLENRKENLEETDSLLYKNNGEKIFQADATNLKEIESESIDFIYTDPPYGAKIPYLDLSIMWNVWLDFEVSLDTKEKECIEKGSLEKTRYDYYQLMKQSLKQMYRVLKFNRWLAFVFQHQDPKLFQIITDTAENLGFEYAGSVRQDNGQTSFKKRQNPTTVLSGQIIIYFKKVDNPKVRAKLEVGPDVMETLFKDIEAIIVEQDGANLEEIWNDLVIKAMNNGYLDKLAGKFENFIPSINERFELDNSTQKYHLKEYSSFSNYEIPLELRVQYFIKTKLLRAKMNQKGVSFNDIVFEVLPLSKNGIQANQKMIREILEQLGYEDKQTRLWYLKDKEKTLFNPEDLK